MISLFRAGILTGLVLTVVACRPQAEAPLPFTSSVTLDGAVFEIADAAISSNCLSLAFAVRSYSPPPGALPRYSIPPASSIVLRVDSPELQLDAIPLGGGGGGGGQDDDGRIWMRQEIFYSLSAPVPEGTQVPLDITVVLNEDFGRSEPLMFRLPVVAGPGGGMCSQP